MVAPDVCGRLASTRGSDGYGFPLSAVAMSLRAPSVEFEAADSAVRSRAIVSGAEFGAGLQTIPRAQNVTKREDRPRFERSQVVCLWSAVRGKGDKTTRMSP
jgi:hypothetical protein